MMHVQDMVEAWHRGDTYTVQDALYNVRALVTGQGYCIEEKAAYDAYGRPMVWTSADFNMDGRVDGDDFTLYCAARGTSVEDPNYDWRCNVNQDNYVNSTDYAALDRYYDTSRRPDQASYFTNPFYFTGRTVDVLDGGNLMLQYSRNRYYDYHTGRWLMQDPLGIVPAPHGFINQFKIFTQYRDGLNLYEYARSSPMVFTDSTGLTITKFIDCDEEQQIVLRSVHNAVEVRLHYIKSELEKFKYNWVIENYVIPENRDLSNEEQKRQAYEWHNFWMNMVFEHMIRTIYSGLKLKCESCCAEGQYAYVLWRDMWRWSPDIHFCPDFFWGENRGLPITFNLQTETFLHEFSHRVAQTEDLHLSWQPKLNTKTMLYEGGDLTKANHDADYLDQFMNNNPKDLEEFNVWKFIWQRK